jgi:predicted phosphodiesterase
VNPAGLAAALAVPAGFVVGPYLTDPRPGEITIRFETDRPAAGEVRFATEGEPDRVALSPAGRRHACRLGGLRPVTRYRYRVLLDGHPATEDLAFRTAPPAAEPFSFVVMGDTRSAEEEHRAVVGQLAGETPDLLLHTGDLVEDGAEESGWQSFFSVQAPLIARVPIAPALGNHEAQSALGVQNFARFFGVEPHDGEVRYAFDFGNSRFLIMDTNLMFFAVTAQTAWLDGELQAAAARPEIRHVFVVMHHGPYATGPHGGNPGVRAAWAPLFSAYGVDAVFSGHDHLYERLEQDGVRYFVSGGGGGPLYERQAAPAWEDARASLFSESVHHFLRVEVSGDTVESSAWRADGSLIESVRWRVEKPRVHRPVSAGAPAPVPRPDRRGLWMALALAAAGGGVSLLLAARRRAGNG